jgi:eukaryotic-like serine/threonine-protein kinase
MLSPNSPGECAASMNDRQDATKTPPSALDDLIGKTLGRFRVEDRIGSGGMGSVYKAQDTVLKRTVAIKRLTHQLQVGEIGRERFLREAQRSSALNHPNIASIYDVIEQNTEYLLVMEYVEGKTLRQHLGSHKFTIPEFLRIAVQCAEALATAHDNKILHGDIKPENIMLTPMQRVKILDFGVARRFETEGTTGATVSLATMTGTVAGTPAYMAPEVLEQKAYDGRADLFSLGLVFYEMLGGAQPFLTDSFAGTLGRVLHTEPVPILDVNHDVPAPVASIVMRLLKKDPRERYENAHLLVADLQLVQQGDKPRGGLEVTKAAPAFGRRFGITAGIVGLLVILGIGGYIRFARNSRSATTQAIFGGAPVLPQVRVLAVLPFEAAGQDPKLQAMGEGVTESIASRLGQLSSDEMLEVIPPDKLAKLKVTSLADAAKQFGANVGLTLELQPNGDLIRVGYSITDARNGHTLGSDTVSVPASDAFTLEDDVIQGTVKALQLNLRSEEQVALRVHGTTRPEAYRYYLQARGYLLNFTSAENVDNAITMVREALKIDPNFGMAKAALGEAYWRKYWHTKQPKWTELAKQECDSAVQLGNAGAAGHSCLGLIADGTGKYKDAVTEYRRAMELEPSNEDAYIGLALAYEHDGDITKAEATYQAAVAAHPQSWVAANALGNFYLRRDDYQKAVAMFTKVTELAPEGYAGYVNLGATYNDMGRYRDAIAPLKKSLTLRPIYASYVNLGTAYFYLRDYQQSAAAAKEAIKLDPNQYVVWGNLGEALYYSGAKAESVPNYRKAIELAQQDLKVNPQDSGILADLANYYAMLGQTQQAHDYLDRALQHSRNDKEILAVAAVVHNELGETGLAREWLNKALLAGYPESQARDEPALQNLFTEPQKTEGNSHSLK